MEKPKITCQPRIISGHKVKKLRAQGLTPANVYGKKIKSTNIQLDTKKFINLYPRIGESTLVYLQVAGEKEDRPVFISDLVLHPVSGSLQHVVFHQVDLKEKVTAPVAIKLVGESEAEKEKLGILVQQLDELEVEALPTDMPEHIEVEISGLSVAGANIKVADLKIDTAKLTVKTDPGTIIVQIETLAKEEEVVPSPPAEGTIPAEGAPVPEGATPATAAAPEKSEPKPKA